MQATRTQTVAPAIDDVRARRVVVTIMLSAIALDMSVSPAASPAAARAALELRASAEATAWLSQGFDCAYICATVCSLWAIARFGARAFLTGSLTLFALGSALCAIAATPEMLVGARIAAGAGLGGCFATALLTIVAAAPQRDLPLAMTALSAVMLAAPVLAPLLGGMALGDGSWRVVFGDFALLGALVAAASVLRMRDPSPPAALAFDPPSFGALALAASSFEFIVVQGAANASIAKMPVAIASCVLVICALTFLVRQRRASASGLLVDVSVLMTPVLAAGLCTAVLLGALLSGAGVQALEVRAAFHLSSTAAGAFGAVRLIGIAAGLLLATVAQRRGVSTSTLLIVSLTGAAGTCAAQAFASGVRAPLETYAVIAIVQSAAFAVALGSLASVLFGTVDRQRFASLAVFFKLAAFAGAAVALCVVAIALHGGLPSSLVWCGASVVALVAAWTAPRTMPVAASLR